MSDLTYINFRGSKIALDRSWETFFASQIIELQHIEKSIGTDFTPSTNNIFKIFKLPINKISFVIIGQDPYPQNGIATGRSFEINENSWHYVNRSLEAILVSIYYHTTKELLSYYNVLEKINSMKWNILPPNQLFSKLEKQSGCFFLNKSLTCQIQVPNSHETIWGNFTAQLVSYISSKYSPHWLLWGGSAHKIDSLLNKHQNIIKSTHPAFFSHSNGTESEIRLFDFAKNSGIDKILNSTNFKLI